ncbi:hypothetical protein [uncultured Alistipes sp.]|uniref:hypothetical protein n=1 Tax=Alistipes sp. TaxID=1872444 RepID=UPI0026370C8A|nr:hypothetical protein [uncultured Alistipes sp.]
MKERKERIEKLLERYFDARTTDDEEAELRAYFQMEDEVDAGLLYARTMFCGMDGLAAERLPAARRPAGNKPAARRMTLRLCGMAAAAAVVLGLFLCVEYLRRPYCYIDGVAVYDKEVAMQATVYLQAFSEFSDPGVIVDELIEND